MKLSEFFQSGTKSFIDPTDLLFALRHAIATNNRIDHRVSAFLDGNREIVRAQMTEHDLHDWEHRNGVPNTNISLPVQLQDRHRVDEKYPLRGYRSIDARAGVDFGEKEL